MAAAVTFYGMATFEGPLLSIRAVSSLAHYSDWIIGHVHAGTLGWNGFMAAGMIYFLLPRLWNRPLHSVALANMHFWIGLVGILLYVAAMWVSGITQGLMLNATDASGTSLAYPNFIDTLLSIRNLMLLRAIGGALYLLGFILLGYNVLRTIIGARPLETSIKVADKSAEDHDKMGWRETFHADPVSHFLLVCLFASLWFILPDYANFAALITAGAIALRGTLLIKRHGLKWDQWHDRLLRNWAPFTVLAFIAVAIGGAVQIIPGVVAHKAASVEDRVQVPYTPLELAGRDIYISEGCYNCHSQMIRTLVPDVMRYGSGSGESYSRLGESIYDYPFQWGSKRTGPDLAREGGKRNHLWHYDHMLDPRKISPGSNMPAYPWMFEKSIDYRQLPGRIAVLRLLGVPYEAMDRHEIEQGAQDQAHRIATELIDLGATPFTASDKERPKTREEAIAQIKDTEIVALISYLQKLGTWEPPAHVEKALDELARH